MIYIRFQIFALPQATDCKNLSQKGFIHGSVGIVLNESSTGLCNTYSVLL